MERLKAFRDGLFYIQDPAARLAVIAMDVKPGDRVLDVCAAPGGKSFAAAIVMEDRGNLLACDLHANKLKRIREGAERLGLTCIETAAADGRTACPEWAERFDAVLVDAPVRAWELSGKSRISGTKRPAISLLCRWCSMTYWTTRPPMSGPAVY